MSRPKLPSQLHPDYPKGTYSVDPVFKFPVYKASPLEDYRAFYRAHPEYDNEGEYEFQCPYCCNPIADWDNGVCCGEAQHGEWVLIVDEPISVNKVRQHLHDLYWENAPAPEIIFWGDYLIARGEE